MLPDVIIRTWRARLTHDGADAYDAFARQRSRPMFIAAPGCLGFAFGRESATERSVVTVWSSASALADFEASAVYREVAGDMAAAPFIAEVGAVTVLHCDHAEDRWLASGLVS